MAHCVWTWNAIPTPHKELIGTIFHRSWTNQDTICYSPAIGVPTRYMSLFSGTSLIEVALAMMQTETKDLTVQLEQYCMNSYFVAPDQWEPFWRKLQFEVKTKFEQGSKLWWVWRVNGTTLWLMGQPGIRWGSGYRYRAVDLHIVTSPPPIPYFFFKNIFY